MRRKCFKCGKVGHLKRDCKENKSSSNGENIMASLNINETSSIDCYSCTYIDSACSCHTVTSLRLLDEGTAQRASKNVRAVDGTVITLTHKGKRTIHTRQGVITLSEVYYADELKYNLMSVPTMAKLGVNVTFGHDEAFIEKNESRIYLRKVDGLWALPEEETRLGIASLRMEMGGSADAEIWHRRLGHPSDNKLKQMIKSGVLTREAAGCTAAKCRTCQLTHPKRRPVPGIAERSGKVTVQVDYMPMGHREEYGVKDHHLRRSCIKEKGVYVCIYWIYIKGRILVPLHVRSIQTITHGKGSASIRQTERRNVPFQINLHLRCVCHFNNIK